MNDVPAELASVARRVEAGERPTATVRTLVGWFGQKRRGYYVVKTIRRGLARANLTTDPDFEDVWIDSEFTFAPRPSTGAAEVVLSPVSLEARGVSGAPGVPADGASPIPNSVGIVAATEPVPALVSGSEPVAKIGHLAAAARKPVSVARDKELAEATTLMLTHDYSQLPVMNDARRVDGMISWRSIGRARSLGKDPTWVREALDPQVRIVRKADSFYGVVQEIVVHDAVLVRDEHEIICGIVTAADISMHFRGLSEPFLLIGEIERVLRRIIGDKFDRVALQTIKDPADVNRVVDTADDLTFGEYIRLLETPVAWTRLALPLDRGVVMERLRVVNRIRNDVMHFDPDGTDKEDVETLRRIAEFLQLLL